MNPPRAHIAASQAANERFVHRGGAADVKGLVVKAATPLLKAGSIDPPALASPPRRRRRKNTDHLKFWTFAGLHRRQLRGKQHVLKPATGVDQHDMARLAAIAHRPQHAHERGDPHAAGDEHQMTFPRMKRVAESAKWTVNGGAIAG